MTYTVVNDRAGFKISQHFDNYDKALDFYKSECAATGGPVRLFRWDEEGNIEAVLHDTRG